MSKGINDIVTGICGIGMLITTGLIMIAAVVCMIEDYTKRNDIR